MLSEADKEKFAAALPELVEFAKVQEFVLTKQQVEGFFEDISLTKEHYEQIYAYLMANQIEVQDVKTSSRDVQKYEERAEYYVPAKKSHGEKKRKEMPYLQMYLHELKQIPVCKEGEELDLYARLLEGDVSARERLAQGKLHRVLEIVREYVEDGLITEDLIQEGNMGLMIALSELLGAKKHEDCRGMIDDYIRQSVAYFADEQINFKDQERKVLAKINLVQEAAKMLAEEMGRIATIQELAEYTRLPIDEVEDIISLSEGRIEVGSGDIRSDEDREEEGPAGPVWDFKL